MNQPQPLRICGVSCVMDAPEILASAIKHLVLNGVQDFYLFDHCREIDLLEYFEPLFRSEQIRIQIVRKRTRPFYHKRMMDVLTQLARLDGFDVAIAFDADEFWCSAVEGRTLAEQIRLDMASGCDALRVPVTNYVQHHEAEIYREESLLQCRYIAEPHNDPTTHQRLQMDAGIPFAALPFPTKILPRLSATFKVSEGQHELVSHTEQARVTESSGVLVRHLPLHSKQHMTTKREQGIRRIEDGFPARTGWQSQRLAHMTEAQLHEEWMRNAWRHAEDGRVRVGTYDRILEDPALARIGQALLEAETTFRPSGGAGPSSLSRVTGDRLEEVLQFLIDDFGLVECKLQECTEIRDRLEAEIQARKSTLLWKASSLVLGFLHALWLAEKKIRKARKRLFRKRSA